MTSLKSFFAAVLLAGALIVTGSIANQAQAQGPQAFEGDFMIRLLGAGIYSDTDLGRTTLGGAVVPGADAEIDDTIVPATTLTYFFSPNIAAELFCCIARVDVDGKGGLGAFGELASTSFFAPTVTLQYHIPMGAIKPYVGVGINYLLFYNEDVGSGLAGVVNSVDIDNSWGLALQAGVDVALSGNWSLNLDVKRIFTETDVNWKVGGATLVAARDLQIDPWIISVGVGYRFNLADVFNRGSDLEPLK